MKWILILSSILLCSCSAQWHLKRAIKKDPTILQEKVVTVFDTTIVRDSVVYHDTFVAHELDTIVLEHEKADVVIYKYRDRYHVETKIKSDTIELTKEIKVPQLVYKEKATNWLWFVLLIVLFILMYYVAKIQNTK